MKTQNQGRVYHKCPLWWIRSISHCNIFVFRNSFLADDSCFFWNLVLEKPKNSVTDEHQKWVSKQVTWTQAKSSLSVWNCNYSRKTSTSPLFSDQLVLGIPKTMFRITFAWNIHKFPLSNLYFHVFFIISPSFSNLQTHFWSTNPRIQSLIFSNSPLCLLHNSIHRIFQYFSVFIFFF